MESKQRSRKKYCVAKGCARSSRKNQDLSFFSLPKDVERRRHWLTLIGRDDLLQKEDLKHRSYELCSEHFDNSSILIVKQLTKDAIPTKFLHNQPQEDDGNSRQISVQTQTYSAILYDKETQTGLETKCEQDVKLEPQFENDASTYMDSECIEYPIDIKEEFCIKSEID